MDTTVTSCNGRLVSGMKREDMQNYITSKGMSESDRAAKKLMKAFDFADGLVDGVKDNEISSEEIEAYDKKIKNKNILTGLAIAGGALAVGTAAFILVKKANTGRYEKLLKQYTKLVDCKSGDLAYCEPYLQYDLVAGTKPRWNMITGNEITKYPLSFNRNWKDYRKLLKEYAELVGGKSSSVEEYSKLLQADLKSGTMPVFNCLSGEKFDYAKSFIRRFKSFMA